jgi:hypothetical protein
MDGNLGVAELVGEKIIPLKVACNRQNRKNNSHDCPFRW